MYVNTSISGRSSLHKHNLQAVWKQHKSFRYTHLLTHNKSSPVTDRRIKRWRKNWEELKWKSDLAETICTVAQLCVVCPLSPSVFREKTLVLERLFKFVSTWNNYRENGARGRWKGLRIERMRAKLACMFKHTHSKLRSYVVRVSECVLSEIT